MSQEFEIGGPPRHGVPWKVIGASVAVLIVLAGLTVWLAQGRGADDVSESVSSIPHSTTTVADSPHSLADGATSDKAGEQLMSSRCSPIRQPFPLPARSCRIGVPPGIPPGQTAPVVILLHGFNVSAEQVVSAGGWDEAAVRDRFTLVLPEGQASSWNAGGCCALAQRTNIDDVGYLTAVLDQVSKLPSTDPSRIYVVGVSNGGMMAYRFGCARSDRIAAIVSVEGTPVSNCAPTRPIPVLHVHGRADQVVPYAGGQSLESFLLGVTFPPVPGSVGKVATAMGCGAPAPDVVDAAITTRDWTTCAGGAHVRLVSIDGQGHTWPTSPYDATAEIEEFLGLRP